MSRILLTVIVLLIVFSTTVVVAQDQTCAALIESALAQAGTACATVASGSICYVSGSVTVAPALAMISGSEGGARAALDEVDSVLTSAANPTERTVGLAIMRTLANVPPSLGQDVLLALANGWSLEEATEDPLPPASTTVNVTAATNGMLQPAYDDRAADPVLSVPVAAGTALVADATSPDRSWVRVIAGQTFGWINRAALDPNASLDGLQVIGPDDFTPMQAFYLNPPADEAGCPGLAPVLLIQGPRGATVDLRISQHDIRLGSTALLRLVPADNPQTLEIIALFGEVILFPGTANEIIIPAGFKSTTCLGEVQDLGVENDTDDYPLCDTWTPPQPLTQDELAALAFLAGLPTNVLNYAFGLPTFIQASGVGGPVPRLVFADSAAIEAVAENCALGRIPENVCAVLIGP